MHNIGSERKGREWEMLKSNIQSKLAIHRLRNSTCCKWSTNLFICACYKAMYRISIVMWIAVQSDYVGHCGALVSIDISKLYNKILEQIITTCKLFDPKIKLNLFIINLLKTVTNFSFFFNFSICLKKI